MRLHPRSEGLPCPPAGVLSGPSTLATVCQQLLQAGACWSALQENYPPHVMMQRGMVTPGYVQLRVLAAMQHQGFWFSRSPELHITWVHTTGLQWGWGLTEGAREVVGREGGCCAGKEVRARMQCF